MDSKVISGKARTGSFGFIVPKYRNAVVLELPPDGDQDSAISSSIK